MKWFKHYSNATDSNSLTELIAKTGFEGYGRYWRLLELMSEKFDGVEDEKFVFITKDLMRIMRTYHLHTLQMYLQCVANVCSMSIQCDKDVTVIYAPILLELQSRDFKKARSDRAQTAPKSKDLRLKNKEEEPKSQKAQLLSNKYFKRISPDSQSLLFNSYPLEFLQREIITGSEWIEKQPLKYMGGEAAFLVSHFSRQWAYNENKKPKPVDDSASRQRSVRALANTQEIINRPNEGVAVPENLKPMIEKLTRRKL